MRKRIGAIFVSLLMLSACQNSGIATKNGVENKNGIQNKISKREPTLYSQLGEYKKINQAVTSMVKKLHHDERLGELFSDVDDHELIKNFTDFLCQLSDGDCEYQGASMEDTHTELFITKAEFDRFVSLFIFSMKDANIPFRAQNKLLKRLADLRAEVIEL